MTKHTATSDALASEAFISGRRAGLSGLSPSLQPHLPGSAEYVQWQQGWQSGHSDRAYEDVGHMQVRFAA